MPSLEYLINNGGFDCKTCERRYSGKLKDCVIGGNALEKLPETVKKYGSKPFILCDRDTYLAAGERVCELLKDSGITFSLHIVERKMPAPDEFIAGEALMHLNRENDLVIAVGGGVINDTCKLLAAGNLPDIVVATAPSMDGFASATSSMERGGLKVSLPTKCPDAVIGDSRVLAAAPKKLILSGIGDMLAKYVSLAEWRIAHLLIGEYYCPEIADMVQNALEVCKRSGPAALNGDLSACEDVMRGLTLAGLAMNYAGLSRPASGMEHYISHILDMRALESGGHAELHGIQCALGTLVTLRAYEALAKRRFDRDRALKYAAGFDLDNWFGYLRSKLGRGAEAIIAGELTERKYDGQKHYERLGVILENESELRGLIAGLPSSGELRTYMESLGLPTTADGIGVTRGELREAFIMAKDIRDKYVLGRLLWDLGLLEEVADEIINEF